MEAHKIVLTSKTRLGKRKLQIKEVSKEKQETASKKHDKKCFAPVETFLRKPQTMSYLSDKMKSMKQLNDALLEEVKNNEEAISILQDKVKK